MFVYIIFEVLNNVPVGIITGTEKKINSINAIQIETTKKKTSFQQWQFNDDYISLHKFTDITH